MGSLPFCFLLGLAGQRLFFEDGWGADRGVDAAGEELFAHTEGWELDHLCGEDSEGDSEEVGAGELPGGDRPGG